MVNGYKICMMQNNNTRTFDKSLIRIGQKLRSERETQNISLFEMSKLLDVSKGYLSRIESGKTKISRDTLSKIAPILGIDDAPLGILAGHLPNDVKSIFYDHPIEAPALLREHFTTLDAKTLDKTEETLHKEDIPQSNNAKYNLFNDDCISWMKRRSSNSIHAIITDPPYGIKEYTEAETKKMRNGRGGVWRIPPALDGYKRNPVPRFTILNQKDISNLELFFYEWAKEAIRVMVPGAHLFIASNPLLSQHVYNSLIKAGFEKRGEIIRLVQTLRGGDRPKNAHKEYADISVMPRSCWEPWGLFRKPCEGRVQDNLRKWQVGGLRRISADRPFMDIIKSSPTNVSERKLASHPSLKPQAFMRQIVKASLPMGEGIILDPFMGAGSTIAAACSIGYQSIGVEIDKEYFQIAQKAIPKLIDFRRNNEEITNRTQETLFECA